MLKGIRRAVADAVTDMQAAGEDIPVPLAEKHYSGGFRVRIPPQVHRALVTEAADQGFSLNQLASANWRLEALAAYRCATAPAPAASSAHRRRTS